jgi:hypothetical protein
MRSGFQSRPHPAVPGAGYGFLAFYYAKSRQAQQPIDSQFYLIMDGFVG